MDLFLEYLRAFLCGGLLCLIGQILIDRTTLTPAKILVIYVVSGVVLGGLGIYKYIVQWGGAGATVPLTGFGYLLAKGVAQAVEEGGLLGAFTGGVTAAAGGISARALIREGSCERQDRKVFIYPNDPVNAGRASHRYEC